MNILHGQGRYFVDVNIRPYLIHRFLVIFRKRGGLSFFDTPYFCHIMEYGDLDGVGWSRLDGVGWSLHIFVVGFCRGGGEIPRFAKFGQVSILKKVPHPLSIFWDFLVSPSSFGLSKCQKRGG